MHMVTILGDQESIHWIENGAGTRLDHCILALQRLQEMGLRNPYIGLGTVRQE